MVSEIKDVFTMLEKEILSTRDKVDLEKILSILENHPPKIEDIWRLMDKVWDELGCDNQYLNWDKIEKFYCHPIWLLNGLFIEKHDLSMQHRTAISRLIEEHSIRPQRILDYGGGFGTLARLIAIKNPKIFIDVFEPHPFEYALVKSARFDNIRFIDSSSPLSENYYDCLLSLDVLEHLPDPLYTLSEMIAKVKTNGLLLIANNFNPVIKCHLPITFHLRYTFIIFAGLMGLRRIGICHGSHAWIYTKNSDVSVNWRIVRTLEKMSKRAFPALSKTISAYKAITPLKTSNDQ